MKTTVSACAVAGALLVLTACGKEAAPPQPADAAVVTNYDVTIETRTDSIERQVGPERGQYDMCVALAQKDGLPVDPFPSAPGGYFVERVTHVRDGQVYARRRESWGIDMSRMKPEQRCTARYARDFDSWFQDGTRLRMKHETYAGERTSGEEKTMMPLVPRPDNFALYTAPRKIAGHDMRCMTADEPALAAMDAELMCVAAAPLYTPDGKALVAALTMRDTIRGTRLVAEPTALRIGGKVDPRALEQQSR